MKIRLTLIETWALLPKFALFFIIMITANYICVHLLIYLLKFIPSWKRAFVRPLLKVNPPSSPSHTRPIANLCELSKIFERVVHRQIIEYITTNDILDCRPSGFRGGYSTQSALLRVRHAVDMGRVTILVLFDFSKAFDTVSHSKLLIKLRGFGFSDIVLTLRIELRL